MCPEPDTVTFYGHGSQPAVDLRRISGIPSRLLTLPDEIIVKILDLASGRDILSFQQARAQLCFWDIKLTLLCVM